MSDEAQTLGTVLDKTARVIDAVKPEQWSASTPCTEWDVRRLVTHLVGWSGNFAARFEGAEPEPEPDAVDVGDSPAGKFRAHADRITTALSSPGEPAENAPQPAILVAEYILHGWDLAVATGQAVPYTDSEAASGLAAMKEMLKPEYRGYGFEAEVKVPDDAGARDQLLAFSGRDPNQR